MWTSTSFRVKLNRKAFFILYFYTSNCLIIQMHVCYFNIFIFLKSNSQVFKEKDIQIYINSPGGSVYAGLGIYDTMQFIGPMQISSNLSLDFRPYGQFFESDKYIEFSLGNIFLIAFHKYIPPISLKNIFLKTIEYKTI